MILPHMNVELTRQGARKTRQERRSDLVPMTAAYAKSAKNTGELTMPGAYLAAFSATSDPAERAIATA